MQAEKQEINFDYSALLGLMREKHFTQQALSNATKISMTQLSAKLNGKYPFKQKDIQIVSGVLGIAPTDIGHYFFSVKS